MAGRTVQKWTRVYVDGYDLSGFGRAIGPLEETYDEVDLTAGMGDYVKGYLRGGLHINAGMFDAVYDSTDTTGLHALMSTSGTKRNVMVPIGMRAAPALGDVCFCGELQHMAYQVAEDAGAVVAQLPFQGESVDATSLLSGGFGVLLHANAAATGENMAAGTDYPNAASTATGGLMYYQVLAGDGTATISIDDSANNSTFAALSGATTGVIDCSSPTAGVIALATGATVRQYLRWQIALGSANTVTFILAFIRR